MAMSWRGQAGVLLRRQKDLYFVTLPSPYEPRGQAGIKIKAEMKVEVSTATGGNPRYLQLVSAHCLLFPTAFVLETHQSPLIADPQCRRDLLWAKTVAW